VAAPYFLCIQDKLGIAGYKPDVDTVHFIANDVLHYDQSQRADRIRPSQRDGSVQLHFEGVDAPALHYGTDPRTCWGEGCARWWS
jgi:hypothetical protein